MSILDIMRTASTVFAIRDSLSAAAKILGNKDSTPEEKSEARKAQNLGNKKVQEKNKGGAVTKMYHGGMAHGRKHMYLGGDSSVKDNAGLRALKIKSPSTYTKITGRNA